MFDVIIVILLIVKIDNIFIILFTQFIGELYELNYYLGKFSIIPLVLLGFTITIEYSAIYYLLLVISYVALSIISFYQNNTLKLDEEVKKYRKLANSYGKIIENSREFERQALYTSLLEDRNKLAQEMHDKIGHTIAGSLMQLQAAKILMDNDKVKSQELLENTISVLNTGIDDIRLTLRSIKPLEEELGINRLKLGVEKALKGSEIKGYVNFMGDLSKISYSMWKVIMDNTKESLTNSIKYSNCRSFWVNINIMNKMIKIELKDDGKGTEKVVKGMGLRGMEQRCDELGAKLIINGDYGFTLVMLIPI